MSDQYPESGVFTNSLLQYPNSTVHFHRYHYVTSVKMTYEWKKKKAEAVKSHNSMRRVANTPEPNSAIQEDRNRMSCRSHPVLLRCSQMRLCFEELGNRQIWAVKKLALLRRVVDDVTTALTSQLARTSSTARPLVLFRIKPFITYLFQQTVLF